MFIVGAWTGLRFGDFTTIRPEQIVGYVSVFEPRKLGPQWLSHFTPAFVQLAKYDNVLPPAISNQKMNAYLREFTAMTPAYRIGASVSSTVAGIRRYVTKAKAELVTTHTARRSFATNYYLKGGTNSHDHGHHRS